MWSNDREILRELAKQKAEIAALPIQQKTKKQWYALNALQPERPMFTIDQLPWHEMDVNNELKLRCEDPFAREVENMLRRELYQWNHFRDDHVIEPFIFIPKIINNVGYGLEIDAEVAEWDDGSVSEKKLTDLSADINSYVYHDQLQSEDDLEKLKIPNITLNQELTAKREEMAKDALNGILEVRMNGREFGIYPIDYIYMWRGTESFFIDFIDQPEFMNKLIKKVADITHAILDQLEEKALLCQPQQIIHCSGAWTDQLPQEGFNPDKPRAKDIWGGGMSQIFSSMSPADHDKYDIEYFKSVYERFGLVAYGCCESLEDKIQYVKKIKNVRKISMSPWVQNRNKGAEQLGKEYIYWAKPSPTILLENCWDPKAALADVQDIYDVCKRHNTPLEYDMKDVSTLNNRPQTIWEWAKMMREFVGRAD